MPFTPISPLSSSLLTTDASPFGLLRYALLTFTIAVIIWGLLAQIGPSFDASEPPALKPYIPLIGHILGAGKYQTSYLRRLNKDGRLKAATLPILTGKLYVMFDPHLAQSAFRSTQLSLLPIAKEAALKRLKLSAQAADAFRSGNLADNLNKAIKASSTGAAASLLSSNSLEYVAQQLQKQDLKREVESKDLYAWVRDVMTMATVVGLFGNDSIFKDDYGLLQDLWTYESDLSALTTSWFPRYAARAAYDANIRVQAALEKWYAAGKDAADDVSAVVKARVALFRKHGFSDAEIAEMEIGLLHVSTSNTIPVTFWLIAHVISCRDLVERIREQLEEAVQITQETATADESILNVKHMEEKCPILTSCWKEALRISIHAGHFRRVLSDTTICDDQGTCFVLKKGFDLLLSSDCSHAEETIWGPQASSSSSFNPDRFVTTFSATEKSKKKAAFHPFGGGKHLCPGRNFAYTEILAFVAGLLLLYDFAPAEEAKGWKLPDIETAMFFEAAAKPVRHGRGFGVVVERRVGWEGTRLILKNKVS